MTLTQSVGYWFNTKTNSVEYGPQSLSLERIGPFATEAEAARALDIIAGRARLLREEDESHDRWD